MEAPTYEDIIPTDELDELTAQCPQDNRLLVHTRVQWFWQLDKFNYVPFTADENAIIEQAYLKFTRASSWQRFRHKYSKVETTFGTVQINMAKLRIRGPPKMYGCTTT